MEEQQIACALADFIRENEASICKEMDRVYSIRYDYSKSTALPAEVKECWTIRLLREFEDDLVADPNPKRYLRANAGDMVIQREDITYPIFAYVENVLFMARVIAPYIWRRYINDPDTAYQLIEYMEKRVPLLLKANFDDFAASCAEPGHLSRYWNLCPNNDLLAMPTAVPGVPRAPSSGLSPRESDVLRLATSGLSNKEIAAELGMGLSTVKGYMGRLFEKYNVSSRSELTAVAVWQDA